MAKKEPRITVTTFFDGDLQAKDVFAELITEKILQNSNGKPLPKRHQALYNEHSVPQDQGSSGLCGENE